MRTLLMVSSVVVMLATGCAGGADATATASQLTTSTGYNVESLPNCNTVQVPATPITNASNLPTIRHVAGSVDIYVLLQGATPLCVGDFDEVADSEPATDGVIFETRDWASSNPMPGHDDGTGGTNSNNGNGNAASNPNGGSNPMPGVTNNIAALHAKR